MMHRSRTSAILTTGLLVGALAHITSAMGLDRAQPEKSPTLISALAQCNCSIAAKPKPLFVAVNITVGATSVPNPNGGTFAWTSSDANVLAIQGANTNASVNVKGVAPGTTTLKVTYTVNTQTCESKIDVTVFKLDLNSDLNIDGTFNDSDGALRATPGAYVVVNNDDDDRDNTVDVKDGKVQSGGGGARDENDLKEVRLTLISPAALRTVGKIVLSRSSGKIRVFSDTRKGTGADNDKAVLFSDTAASFKDTTEGNGKKTFDLSNAGERAAYEALVTSGVWIEGVDASGSERDQTLTLSYVPAVVGVAVPSEPIKVTAVKFESLTAKIDATPSKTSRYTNDPANHTFSNESGGIVRFLDENTSDRDKNFEAPRALVLIRKSAQGNDRQAALEVKREPAVALKWTVARSADDAGGLGAGTPSITPDNPAVTAALSTDEKGSFLVSCYVDANGNGSFEVGEPRIILPLILATATLHANASADSAANFSAGVNGAGGKWPARGRFRVTSGQFDIANPGRAAVYLAATVDFVGGGGNGRRGLDRVFGGWVNNETAVEDLRGTYQGGHKTESIFAETVPAGGFILPGAAAPTLVAPPLLDSGRGSPGTGGNTATLTTSRHGTASDLTLGRRILVEAVDSPGQSYPGDHPGFGGFGLTNARFNLDFGAWLCVWTNANGNDGASRDVAERTYSVVLEFAWTLRGEWNINAAGATAQVVAPAATRGGATSHDPAARARDRTVEVRPPTGLNHLATDAQN